MIRPAGRVGEVSKTRGSNLIGSGGDRNEVMGQLGSGQEVSVRASRIEPGRPAPIRPAR